MESTVKELRFIPQSQNAVLSALALSFQVAALALTPILWRWNGWAFAAYVALYGYGTVLSWLLIHEGIHYKLLANRAANTLVGRFLAITFGCPFHILKIGHMAHHRYNRGTLDTTELVPADTKHFALWWLAYYARILGGLYVSEVISPLVFFFWKRFKQLVEVITKNRPLMALLDLFTRRMVQAIQLDAVLCVAFIALQVWINRSDLTPFIILFFWRGFIVSFYDNAYHYGTDPHDLRAANNLSMPRPVQIVMLNHNLHRVHHRYPTASWAKLRALGDRDQEKYDATLAGTIWQQLKGPMRRPEKTSNVDHGPLPEDEDMELLENA